MPNFLLPVGHQAANCPKAGTPTWYVALRLYDRHLPTFSIFTATTVCELLLRVVLSLIIWSGGGEGHVSRDCTGETKPKACYKCGQEGHLVSGSHVLFPVATPS